MRAPKFNQTWGCFLRGNKAGSTVCRLDSSESPHSVHTAAQVLASSTRVRNAHQGGCVEPSQCPRRQHLLHSLHGYGFQGPLEGYIRLQGTLHGKSKALYPAKMHLPSRRSHHLSHLYHGWCGLLPFSLCFLPGTGSGVRKDTDTGWG